MIDKEKEKQIENNAVVEEKITKVTGEVQIRKYVKGRILGKGGFAKCYEFINEENQHSSAAKIIPKKSLKFSKFSKKNYKVVFSRIHNPKIIVKKVLMILHIFFIQNLMNINIMIKKIYTYYISYKF